MIRISRAARLGAGIDRLVIHAKNELDALGIDTTGKLPLQMVAMARDEKRRASAGARLQGAGGRYAPSRGTSAPAAERRG